jgi:hypothetical protein
LGDAAPDRRRRILSCTATERNERHGISVSGGTATAMAQIWRNAGGHHEEISPVFSSNGENRSAGARPRR